MYRGGDDESEEPSWVSSEREQFFEFRDKNKDGVMDEEEVSHVNHRHVLSDTLASHYSEFPEMCWSSIVKRLTKTTLRLVRTVLKAPKTCMTIQIRAVSWQYLRLLPSGRNNTLMIGKERRNLQTEIIQGYMSQRN